MKILELCSEWVRLFQGTCTGWPHLVQWTLMSPPDVVASFCISSGFLPVAHNKCAVSWNRNTMWNTTSCPQPWLYVSQEYKGYLVDSHLLCLMLFTGLVFGFLPDKWSRLSQNAKRRALNAIPIVMNHCLLFIILDQWLCDCTC